MCLFCEIVKGNIPSCKVYEDDEVLAFLDIAQATKGHTLVVPKKHYDNVLEMPDDEYASLLLKAKKVAGILTNSLKPNGVNVLTNIGEAAGQSIMHAHVHVIPRYDSNDGVSFEFKENECDLNSILTEIK